MKDIVIPTLEADDIEVKVKQVTKNGAFALLYKTARTDMRILDDVFGINNWQVEYERIGEVLYCTISIWDEEKKQWVKKQNCGIESREDGEGNEVKGEASDAQKRAGFLVGIGRELYSSPRVFLNVKTKQDGEFKGKPIYKLEDPWAKYIVTDIGYDTKRKIIRLVIANEKTGEIVYRYGDDNKPNAKAPTKTKGAPKQEAPKQDTPKQDVPKAQVTVSDTLPMEESKETFMMFLKRHKLSREKFIEMRNQAINDGKPIPVKSMKELTPDEWMEFIATMETLYFEGYFKDDVA